MNKGVLLAVILAIILLGGFLLFNFIESYMVPLVPQTPEGFFESITTNEEYRACAVDEDCTVFHTDCSDCEFKAINKGTAEAFSDLKRDYCQENLPEIMCDAVFQGSLACVNGFCEIS